MSLLSGDGAALILKLVLGTFAFGWILWTVRAVNPRAVGMTLTFPALNGVVLLTVTDKIVSEMVVAIFPMMFFNGFLAAVFIALRRKLAGAQWLAIALCVVIWAIIATLMEWDVLQAHRWVLAGVSAILILLCAGWAFAKLRSLNRTVPTPGQAASAGEFLRGRAPRIFWFFVSLLIVLVVAYVWRDAHSLVGRLSAMPLITLFVLHWAVNERRVDLGELRIAALIGPVTAGGFLILFAWTLSLIRSDGGALHPGYWPIGLAALLLEWELARRVILALSRLTYRT